MRHETPERAECPSSVILFGMLAGFCTAIRLLDILLRDGITCGVQLVAVLVVAVSLLHAARREPATR